VLLSDTLLHHQMRHALGKKSLLCRDQGAKMRPVGGYLKERLREGGGRLCNPVGGGDEFLIPTEGPFKASGKN